MTLVVSEETLRTAAAFQKATAEGIAGNKAIAAIADEFSVSRDVVRSRLRRQGLWGTPDFDKVSGRVRAGLHDADWAADRRVPPTAPVDRDPCPRCGVRRDIGCHHSLAPLGMVL